MNLKLNLSKLFVLLLFCTEKILSQPAHFCGTSVKTQQLMLEKSNVISNTGKDQVIIYLPLQIHMLLTDQGNGTYNLFFLEESLCTLNNDFAETGFQFYLEKEINYIKNTEWDNHERFEKGIEMMHSNNVDFVINCYIVTNPAGNCGYFAWDGDAIALSKSCLGGSTHTWAHEMGHYFSLPHTFFGWEGTSYNYSKPTSEYQNQVWRPIENVVRDGCKAQADEFCDTPPDYISVRWNCNEDKRSNYLMKDINGEEFTADGSLFMSYSNDRCMSRFSSEQSEKMRQFLMSNRSYLLRSQVNYLGMENLDKNQMTPQDSSTSNTERILFSWPDIDNADFYYFQLSRNAAFTLPVKFERTRNNFIEIENLQANRNYYWRVKPVNSFQFCNPTSGTLYFNTIVSSVSQHSSRNLAELSPNPINQSDDVFLKIDSEIQYVQLIGLCGEIQSISFQRAGEGYYKLSTGDILSGTYMIKIYTSHGFEEIKKLIIQ